MCFLSPQGGGATRCHYFTTVSTQSESAWLCNHWLPEHYYYGMYTWQPAVQECMSTECVCSGTFHCSDAHLMDPQMTLNVSRDFRGSVVDIVCINIFISRLKHQP